MKRLVPVLGLLAVIAGWSGLGCYNPSIADGQIKCSSAGECPDGFTCGASNLCWSNGSGSGKGGATTGGVVGTGGAGGSVGSGGAGQCVGPLPLAQCAGAPIVSGGICDPVCQAGCACSERCNVVENRVACMPPGGNKAVTEDCAAAAQNCSPGLICLPEADAKCGQHCYRHCRTDVDCNGRAHCTIQLQDSQGAQLPWRVCDSPAEECNPAANGRNCVSPNRPFPNFGCYIAGSQFPDEALCDCAGTVTENQPCRYERECVPGLICVNSDGAARCRLVCPFNQPAIAKTICGLMRTCVRYNMSNRFGYCL